MPSKRPYIQHSIVQLEDLFAQAKQDSTVMDRLEHELSFRETKRAAELRNRAQEHLLKDPDSTSKTATPKSTAAKIQPVALKLAPRGSTAAAPEHRLKLYVGRSAFQQFGGCGKRTPPQQAPFPGSKQPRA